MSGFGNGFGTTLGFDGFGSGFGAPTVVETADLVLSYDISNVSSYPGSGTTVTDLQGSSNASLVNSPTYAGGYLTFNGTNQYLVTSTSLYSKVPTDVTTISIWAYPMDNGVILTERGNASLVSGWYDAQMEMVGGVMKFSMWPYTLGAARITSSVATPFNRWYQFTMTYDGTKLTAYVNGVEAGSATYSRDNPGENGSGLHYVIAGPSATNMGDGTYAKMMLGEFQVYSNALSASQVLSNYNSSKSKYGVVTDNLQMYLTAGDTASYPGSGTSWTDLSTNAYVTTLTNGVTYASTAGGTLSFTGTQYIDTNQSLASETFTVGAWFKTSAAGIQMILSKETAAGWPWNYRIWLSGGQIVADVAQGGSGVGMSSPLTTYNNGDWYQVMFTRDDSNWYLYVNGQQVATQADTFTGTIINSQEVWIGRSAYLGGSYQFVGDISEVMVYHKVLSSAEILKNYNETKARFGL